MLLLCSSLYQDHNRKSVRRRELYAISILFWEMSYLSSSLFVHWSVEARARPTLTLLSEVKEIALLGSKVDPVRSFWKDRSTSKAKKLGSFREASTTLTEKPDGSSRVLSWFSFRSPACANTYKQTYRTRKLWKREGTRTNIQFFNDWTGSLA